MIRHKFIAIEGNIGAGKTSLATILSREWNSKLILERFSENPFLPLFYSDPERYAFPLELSFMADRYSQLKEDLQQRDLFHDGVVSDYYFMKSFIFAGVTLKDDELKLFRNLFNIIYHSLPKPDLLIFLHNNTEQLLENIKKRGRGFESAISESYLDKLSQAYSTFLSQSDFPILFLDAMESDFVNDSETTFRLIKLVKDGIFPKGITKKKLKDL